MNTPPRMRSNVPKAMNLPTRPNARPFVASRGRAGGASVAIATLLALSALLFTVGNASARENIGKLGAASSGIGLQYERALSERLSVSAQIGRAAIDATVDGRESAGRGTGLLLSARYYLRGGGDPMEGIYIGPHYIRIDTEDDAGVETDLTSVGLSAGYQFVTASRFTAEIAVGLGSLDLESDRSDIEFLDALGVFPHVGIAVGYGF